MHEAALYFNVATFVAVVGGLVGIFKWLSSEIRSLRAELTEDREEFRDYFSAQIENLVRDVKNNEMEVQKAHHGIRESLTHTDNRVGEMSAALRTKISEVEFWVRDKYVDQKTFDVVIDKIEKSFDRGVDRLEEYIKESVGRVEKSIENISGSSTRRARHD